MHHEVIEVGSPSSFEDEMHEIFTGNLAEISKLQTFAQVVITQLHLLKLLQSYRIIILNSRTTVVVESNMDFILI